MPVDEPEILNDIKQHYQRVNDDWMAEGGKTPIIDFNQLPGNVLGS